MGIGSEQVIDRIKSVAGEGERETEWRGRPRERVRHEDVVGAVERVRHQKREVWLHKHGDWGKWLVLRLARPYSGITLSELGEEAGGSDYAAVSVGLRRFEKRSKTDRALRRACEKAKQMLNV